MSSFSNAADRLRQAVASLQQEIQPQRLLPTLVAGSIASISTVMYVISFASLVYRGELASHLSIGIGFGLIANAILSVVIGSMSSLPGMVTMVQEAPVVLLALMAQTIAVQMAGAAPAAILLTVVVALSSTALLAGVGALLLGWFKLGDLIRFIPYPVVGGFLAGTGWLLSLGALSLLIDQPVELLQLLPILQATGAMKWLPGCLLGGILLVILRRFNHVLLLPGLLLASVIGFYGWLFVTGTSIEEARQAGLFLNLSASETLLPSLPLAALSQVDWAAIATQATTSLCIVLITILGFLLNATGIELAAGQNIHLNRELRATGIANLLCGFSGGMIGFHSLGLSTLSYAKLGVRNRLVGIIVALVSLLVLFAGVSLIALFPKFILGGVLLFLGLEFLADWLYVAWFKLPKLDYGLVLLISLVITIVGFLQGVGLGLAITIGLFVINYSQISVAKHVFSGVSYHSNQVRTLPQVRLLREQGEQIQILTLQGFLFFGTVNQLQHLVRQQLLKAQQVPLKFVIFDFCSVTGFDSSAVFGLIKLKQLAQQQELRLAFTALSAAMLQQLQSSGCFDDASVCQSFPDLDQGLEWCENQILNATSWRRRRTLPMPLQLNQLFATHGQAAVLMRYLEKIALESGQVLFQQGDPVNCLYFVQQGQITTYLTLKNGSSRRIQTAGAGTMVGEIDFFSINRDKPSAVADELSQIYSLSKTALQKMQQKDPEIAVTFQDYMIHLLSEHLAEELSKNLLNA